MLVVTRYVSKQLVSNLKGLLKLEELQSDASDGKYRECLTNIQEHPSKTERHSMTGEYGTGTFS